MKNSNNISLMLLGCLLACPFVSFHAAAQTSQITDSMPATVNGLTMGYHIKSEEEKEVGKKGNFSRFAVKFYVINTTPEAKIILYKDGWNVLGNVSDQLVQFNCANATGARFTSKTATIRAAPCNVIALVDDKDANGKTATNKRFVQIGYWIKAGQTITADAIMIVPLNERPKMEAVYMANSLQPAASATYTDNNNNYNNPNYNNGSPQFGNNNSFIKIKSNWKNTYLNVQPGPLTCSPIEDGWWSAQWQLIPVTGTSYYLIKNRWKENYISLEYPGNMLSSNNQAIAAMWILEPIINSNTYRLKNAGNNSYLNIINGGIQSTNIWNDSPSAKWEIEQ